MEVTHGWMVVRISTENPRLDVRSAKHVNTLSIILNCRFQKGAFGRKGSRRTGRNKR